MDKYIFIRIIKNTNMSRKFNITKDEIERIKNLYLNEETKEEKKLFCHSKNVKSLEEIVGEDEQDDYIQGIKIRKSGINALTDMVETLKTMRTRPNLNDRGEDLCFKVSKMINQYKPYNYFDETSNQCISAMDKIIELYKENKHGEELVKDLEKVYNDESVSPRGREYIKHCLGVIKGKN